MMKKTEITKSISRTFYKVGFQLKKHSPEILMAAGVAGTVVSGVMACRATLKVTEILETAKNDIASVHEVLENPEMDEEYSVDDSKKDLAIIYTRTGINLAKIYAPSLVIGALSITSILASNNILRKRNVAFAAAYATVDKSFKEYRERVIERFGEEVDTELKYNIKAKEIEETVIDEKGKEKKVKKTVKVASPIVHSDNARYFDKTNPNWDGDSDYNTFFINSQQNYANDLLRAKGFLTLNEVYENLGFPTTKAGMVVGWIYDVDHPTGDNYVDFGFQEVMRETDNGCESVILLDFNIDGNIFEKM